ncbi:MAG TPA: hypothetical protein VE757_09040 [Gaiellaceae bacterium]|nr:hypothetical protein [Gaiellaceae bacterium]
MPDPVSWFLIEKGWRVTGRDDAELGRVQDVLGDENADIFDGLAVVPGLLGKTRYVPSEVVGEIVEEDVRLTIGSDEFERLDPYEPPPRVEP